MLVEKDDRGLKTRLAATALDGLGFTTRITERAFDEHARRAGDEPRIAIAGFDSPAPRQLLEQAGFSYVVDAGLGSSADDYLGIHVRTFPASRSARDVFNVAVNAPDMSMLDKPAYRAEVDAARNADTTLTEEAAKCGILEVAGISVGAAFVGCLASTFALSEVLRMLIADGPRNEAIDVTLRSPQHLQWTPNQTPLIDVNPGFVEAAGYGAKTVSPDDDTQRQT